MDNTKTRALAMQPEDLSRFFVERANAGDLDGLVALFETEAVLAFPPGANTTGAEAIRQVFAQFLAAKPTLALGEVQPALRAGDLALTSTRNAGGGVSVEVARRQPDGGWRWIIDQPSVTG